MQLFIMYLRQNNSSSSKLYRYVLIYIVHNEIELEINSVENFMGTWILMWNLGHIAFRPPPPSSLQIDIYSCSQCVLS